ncbi:MAG: hypothetical protein K2X99_04730 [Gemmatimonadaceae bacterium]|nr:hypothetical protein [Gemmatimonadaceae bacterium]
MGMPKYQTFSVTFEYTDGSEEQRKANRVVVTVYGDSEFAVRAEIQRQYPAFQNVSVLEIERR